MNVKSFCRICIFVGAVVGVYWLSPWREIKHAPGVLVENQPLQQPMAPLALPEIEGWKLTALAKYGLEARVLGTKRYVGGADGDLVPLDVALGWNRMSDQSVLDQFSISMGNRFFFYEWSDRPAIPEQEIMRSASNNHVISANPKVSKVIRSLRTGQIVKLVGYLVSARGPRGETWQSSLRRDDTGKGACELFYVIGAAATDRSAIELAAQPGN